MDQNMDDIKTAKCLNINIFQNRAQAESVLDKLRDKFQEYGVLMHSDLLEALGIGNSKADDRFGWLDLSEMHLEKHGSSYSIHMPEMMTLLPNNPFTSVDRHMDVCKRLNDLYARKNRDYGDSFHQTFLEEGMAMARIRLSDKLSRVKTLTRKESSDQAVTDESVIDTLLDLANYSIMTVMELESKKN